MNNHIEHNLGQIGLNYVEEYLSRWTGLASAAAKLPIQKGRAITFLPANVTKQKAMEFRHGGIELGPEEWKWVNTRFQNIKARHEKCALIVQDLIASPNDASIQRCDKPMFFHNGAIYYFLNGHNFTSENIRKTFCLPSGHFYVCFLVTCGINGQIYRQNVPDETMKLLLDNIAEIYVSAYDCEGHVAWTPGT